MGGDDHHHGPHLTFTPPYSKALIIGIMSGVVGLGIAVPVLAAYIQNKKHGFIK